MLVYLVTNTVNGKQYIGQTSVSIESRWKTHCYNATGSKTRSAYPLYHAIRKYGKNAFSISILDFAHTQAELNEKEKEFIAAYGTMYHDLGYNRHEGGNKPPISTPEARAKAAASNRGQKRSLDVRLKMSAAMKGIPKSPEHREKCGKAVLGKHWTLSKEAKQHQSEARKRWWERRKNGRPRTNGIGGSAARNTN